MRWYMRDRERWYMEMAYRAAENSKDRLTHVGAVLVSPDGSMVMPAWNGFPRGIDDDVPSRQLRPGKYHWFSHAEANAIANAARNGIRTLGCSLYVTTMHPCTDCTRMIIQAGIDTVVYDYLTERDDADHAKTMFREAGTFVVVYPGPLKAHVKLNGMEWEEDR